MMNLPSRVDVVEVGPRDGLQSLDKWVDTETKIKMINRLSAAGFPVIEITSFSHPKAVPNLKDAEDVINRIERRPGTVYRALCPNEHGAIRAAQTSINEILGLMTVSETYLAKNQKMSLDQVIDANRDIFVISEREGFDFIVAVGVSIVCPYEGIISPEQTLHCIERLVSHGIRRFYLAASTGLETPVQVYNLFSLAFKQFPDCEFGFHVHEKIGYAVANVLAALQAGVTKIEGSICGIGGGMAFPNGTGTVGNLASEDIIHFLNQLGIETNISSRDAVDTAREISALLDIPLNSRASTSDDEL